MFIAIKYMWKLRITLIWIADNIHKPSSFYVLYLGTSASSWVLRHCFSSQSMLIVSLWLNEIKAFLFMSSWHSPKPFGGMWDLLLLYIYIFLASAFKFILWYTFIMSLFCHRNMIAQPIMYNWYDNGVGNSIWFLMVVWAIAILRSLV